MLFHDPFDFMARTRPEQLFVDDGSRELTYGEAALETFQIASALASCGIGSGRRFALLSKNSADVLLIYLAASRIGAIVVPLNYRLAGREWEQILADADVAAIIVSNEYVDQIVAIGSALPDLRIVLEESQVSGWSDYRQWVSDGSADISALRPLRDDAVYQMYTSGTTGLPKGVIVSHANFAANLSQVMTMLSRRPKQGDSALIVTPLYHAAAVWIAAFAIQSGMTIHLHRDFNPDAVVDTLEQEQVSFTFLVPTMIHACLSTVGDIADRDLSALKVLMYGASPINEALLRDLLSLVSCDVYQAYGLTETTAILTLLGAEEHRQAIDGKPGLLLSAGRALPGTDLNILAGEIVARGPQIIEGYWRNPEATLALIQDGWLHTGDAGDLDKEGYLYIRDRVKDMVVSGGENIYPREIELVLLEHPKVSNVAVIGVPNARYGESLAAYYIGEASPESLLTLCRKSLAGYKIPRQLAKVDALPQNATGKILKRELKQAGWIKQLRRF